MVFDMQLMRELDASKDEVPHFFTDSIFIQKMIEVKKSFP